MTGRRTPRLVGVAVAALLAGSLVGCSSDDEGDSGAGPSASSGSGSGDGSASASPYLPVPDGVELTEPGSQLSVGDHAVVAYRPRQGQVGALDIDVTRLERTTIKKSFSAWQLTPDQRSSTPYFVHARVKNVGDTDLGGRPVPLYIVDGDNVLVESTPFASAFQPCPSTPLPKKFGGGDKANVCLVYLAPDHGKLVAVSFRPEETFDPITWTGKIQAPKAAEKTTKKKR